MSRETLHLLLGMNHDRLETQIALQCAPLLTGMKISNLLTVSAGKAREVMRIFARTAISCYILYESEDKVTFLLYRPSALLAYLAKEDTGQLMAEFGYRDWELTQILARVSEKYRAHMDGRCGFPHEIGLLLGYPASDVLGFIEHKGKNYLCTGYWKVYSNQAECKRIFRGYSQARDRLIHMVSHGMCIADILEIYEMHQYKAMTI